MNVLITGGASGLGLGCAQRFLALGARVTLADVDVEAGARALRQLDSIHARFEPLDLADARSIHDLAGRQRARDKPIDVLVNNAGIYPPAQRRLTPEGQELCFAIAHVGHFRLTRALWPLLAAAPAARVISISSLVQRRAQLYLDDLNHGNEYTPIRAYAQAKLACLLFAIELQRRLEKAGSRVRSYAAHPGVCRTQLGAHRPQGPDDNRWQRFASAALATLLSRFGQSPEAGAEPVVLAATTDQYPPGSFIGPTGLLEMAGRVGLVSPGKAAADPQLAAALWERTETIVGASWSPT